LPGTEIDDKAKYGLNEIVGAREASFVYPAKAK
jgi:hypothetical protein